MLILYERPHVRDCEWVFMINKTYLAKKLSKRTLFTIRESIQIIETLFDVISEELSEGNEVTVVGFGKFSLYQHKPRPVRNPKTMEEMILKEFESVKFKPSAILKSKVKNK